MISLYSEPRAERGPMSRQNSHEHSNFLMGNDGADGDRLADGYQMLEELGSGSFGVVYKAIDKATGEIVAIKHVDLESSEEDLSDILSELAVLSSCSSTHVTKYRLAFLRRQTLWIVMEYLGGGSCADLLKPPPHSLSESHIAIICRELLLGLSYLHGEGKLHRDIKAANILLATDGRVKLADFGVAAQLVGLKSVRNTFVGTPFWMAPEVIQQEGHDSKADVWSLGITAMELANGEPPHAHVHPMKVLFLIPKQSAPRLEGTSWSKDFRDFVAQCLTKDPDRRASAKELLRHKFIRSAGKVESLQELIIRKQDWQASKGGDRNLKYYAETLKTLSTAQQDDDWVFETVKAVHPRDMRHNQTQKRRKVASLNVVADDDSAMRMMEDSTYEFSTSRRAVHRESRAISSTMRRVSNQPAEPSADNTSTRPVKKRLSSAQARQPLGVNMSFGNSPSTVRQFRRVSPNNNTTNGANQSPNIENEDPNSSVIWTPTKGKPVPFDPFTFHTDMASSHNLVDSALSSPTKDSRFSTASTLATTASADSKEASLGRRLYAKAVGISCQDVLNETGDELRREVVARLAEAFSDLENADPEGLYHIMTSIIKKIAEDTKLKEILPETLSPSPPTQTTQPAVVSMPPPPLPTQAKEQKQPSSPTKISKKPGHGYSKSMSQPQTTFSSSISPSLSPTKSNLTTAAVNKRFSVSPPTSTTSNTTSTPKSPPKPSPNNTSAAKLVLAQNNPHLKSHRRRQSAQVLPTHSRESSVGLGRSNSQIWKPVGNTSIPSSPTRSRAASPAVSRSPSKEKSKAVAVAAVPETAVDGSEKVIKEKEAEKGQSDSERMRFAEKNKAAEEEKELLKLMPGSDADDLDGPLEHNKQLANVLFARWCEGLRVRWPAI